MASKPDRPGWPAWIAATGLSLLGWWFATRLHPLWWAAWLAPIPVLWLATRVSARRAAAAAFLASALASLSWWNYYHGLIRLPVATIALAMVAPGLVFMFTALLYRRLNLSGRPVTAMLAVPALWTAVGFANAQVSPNGTWGDLGYSQMGAPVVIQLAALTGIWGIGFLVLLVAAGIASAANQDPPFALRIRAAGLALAVLSCALGYGGWRLCSTDTTPPHSVQIGLAAIHASGISASINSSKGRQLLQRYVVVAHQLAADGAQIIVLPEKPWSLTHTPIPALAAVARLHKLTLVTGVATHRDARDYNMALAFDGRDDDGRDNAPAEYTKHHLIPGLERAFTPGVGYTTLTNSQRIGLAICKDLDFPSMGRAYAKRGARLLLVPAWDFGVDGWLHSRMAMLRGVESGFAVARAARDGALTLSDDRGRVLAEASSNLGVDAVLLSALPLRSDHTLYARWGNWFAWLNVAGVIVLLWLAWRCKRPPEAGP